jgi:hypothetical protein
VEIFKSFTTDQLKVLVRRVELHGVSYSDATTASRQFDWVQFHMIKRQDGLVDVSLVAHPEKTGELWDFLKGDEPDPVHA